MRARRSRSRSPRGGGRTRSEKRARSPPTVSDSNASLLKALETEVDRGAPGVGSKSSTAPRAVSKPTLGAACPDFQGRSRRSGTDRAEHPPNRVSHLKRTREDPRRAEAPLLYNGGLSTAAREYEILKRKAPAQARGRVRVVGLFRGLRGITSSKCRASPDDDWTEALMQLEVSS